MIQVFHDTNIIIDSITIKKYYSYERASQTIIVKINNG